MLFSFRSSFYYFIIKIKIFHNFNLNIYKCNLQLNWIIIIIFF